MSPSRSFWLSRVRWPVYLLPIFAGSLALIAVARVPSVGVTHELGHTLPLPTISLDVQPLEDEPDEVVVFALGPFSGSPAVPAAAPGRASPTAVLLAIAEIETGGNPHRVGRHGERGMYQFRRTTWRQHTRRDFRLAHHPDVSAEVARQHYDWIVRELVAAGYEGTPYQVALVWNAGLNRFLSGQAPRQSRDYAHRVSNLVYAHQ
jgi:hypothetical protein